MGPVLLAATLLLPGSFLPSTRCGAQELTLEETEAIATFSGAVFQEWSDSYRAGLDPFGEEAARALLAEETGATATVAGEPAPSAPEGVDWLGVLSLPAREESVAGPRAAVIRAFDEMHRLLGGLPDRPLEIAVKGVRPDTDLAGEYEVTMRVRAVSAGAGRQIRARWIARWSIGAEDRRLLGLRVLDRSTLAIEPAGAPAFEDVAGTVLAGRGGSVLARSVADLAGRMDASFGVGVLGHHGVTVADVNGDGIEDLYLCQPGGVPNQLWIRQANGSAIEAGAAAQLDVLDASSSALFLDLDGDGDRDLALASGSSLDIFARTPDGFVNVRRFSRAGITGLAAADVDMDGLLDLYVCAYAGPYSGGALPVPYHDAENGETNMLLMNRTRARDALGFKNELESRGLRAGATRFSFAAAFADVDLDGDPDLYVANDFGRNVLYVNDGTGRFEERAEASGVADTAAGMGVCFADLDQNGSPDLYVSNMESSAGRRITGATAFRPAMNPELGAIFKRHAKGNSLFLGRGDGTFDSTTLAEAGRWAWGSIPVDLDGNGALDLFVPNGFVTGSDGERPDL